MMGRLLNREELGVAMVVALSGTILALVANGPGRLSPGRILSRCLSNPVPRREPAAA